MQRTIPEILAHLSSEDLAAIAAVCNDIVRFPTGDAGVINQLTQLTTDNRVTMMGPAPLIRYGQLKWVAGYALTAERFTSLEQMDDDNIPLVLLESTYEPTSARKALELMSLHPEIEDPYNTEERFRILYEKGLIEICNYAISPTGRSVRKVKESCIGG
jgi:hypothetical protein